MSSSCDNEIKKYRKKFCPWPIGSFILLLGLSWMLMLLFCFLSKSIQLWAKGPSSTSSLATHSLFLSFPIWLNLQPNNVWTDCTVWCTSYGCHYMNFLVKSLLSTFFHILSHIHLTFISDCDRFIPFQFFMVAWIFKLIQMEMSYYVYQFRFIESKIWPYKIRILKENRQWSLLQK